MNIHLYKNDLPDDLDLGDIVAVDSETMGLRYQRDPLCVVQLSGGDGEAHVVQVDRNTYDAPNLKKLLSNPDQIKIFHFARFDIAVFHLYLGIDTQNVYCTRTASKLVRTYTDRHGLKHCCRELLGVEISKNQQSSDWGAKELSKNQLEYAANDVLHLHALKEKLDEMLIRENRMDLAQKCFNFLSTRAELDILGWADTDIFEH